jgi:4-alpha-glucanotransferase
VSRHAGLLIPLFSAPSTSSWGIGEIADIRPLAAWLRRAGFDRLMLLPIGTMATGTTSPYSASSAMAIDPIFIAVEALEDFQRAGGVAALPEESRARLTAARAQPRIDYDTVRHVKMDALDRAFQRFLKDEWEALTLRGAALARYIVKERWWLDDYALFKALEVNMDGRPWREWPAPLAERHPEAIDAARRQLAREVLRQQYLQWIAETEWHAARAAAGAEGVTIFGDVPFMVEANSADVWARADEFRLDATVGAPPDPFSATGQDWGLPVYRWNVIAAGGYAWIRDRARRMAALYDGFRIDHIIGFYRTYARPQQGEPFFTPSDEPAQLAQGETILGIFQDTGAVVVAEDLGVLPHFLRASLDRLGVAGYAVLRWAREWSAPGHPFIDPASYPRASVAATGTHDTETMAVWWETMSAHDRTAVLALPCLRQAGLNDRERPFDDGVRDRLLAAVYGSGSDELFLPVQDVFGWRDRLNTPATVSGDNWTWRLPWAVDRLSGIPEAASRAAFCHALARETGRG